MVAALVINFAFQTKNVRMGTAVQLNKPSSGIT
jgi:hypothetical protein